MARNLKVLNFDDGDYTWSYLQAKSVLDSYCERRKTTKVAVYEDLSHICHLTPDAVKNWFIRKNGPGDKDYVIEMADYFDVDYRELFVELKNGEDTTFMEELRDALCGRGTDKNLDMLKTIRFIGLINELAADSAKGIMGFREFVGYHKYHGTTEEELLDYEYTGPFYPGVVYVDEKGENHGKIVADMCVNYQHSDIIATYDDILCDYCDNFQVIVHDEEPGDLYIEITITDDFCVVIENGRWYCCS